MHQPTIGSTGLYSSSPIYLTRCHSTGNLLTSANSIRSRARAKKNVSDMFPFLKSIPARAYVDKCGQSIRACTVYLTELDRADTFLLSERL